MTEFREHFIKSQGLPIHYLEWGVPKGVPLVLVHGYLDLAYSWRCFVTALQQRHESRALDRCSGLSRPR